MRLQIGLEQEFFVRNSNNELVIAPAELPHDGCGLLAEARGLPFFSPEEAVFSLKADVYRLTNQALKMGYALINSPVEKISKQLRLKAGRAFAKEIVKHQNIYGFEDHRNADNEQTAGIHISFTNPTTVVHEHGSPSVVYGMFDWLSIFKKLDEEFAPEIKAAKRNRGFYELKSDGRIEYRSLPANVDLDKIIEVLKVIINEC